MALPLIAHTNWESIVPKPVIQNPQQFITVEQFVQDAISSRHEPTEKSSSTANAAYRALLDLFRSGTDEDPILLIQVLLALIYNTQGIPLKCIVSEKEKHKMLLHLIFRINPFTLGLEDHSRKIVGENKSPYASILRIENLDASENKQSLLIDVYLHLLVILVSANSTFLSSTLEALWKLLMHTCKTHSFLIEDGIWEVGTQGNNEQGQLENFSRVTLCVLKLHTTIAKVLHLVPKGKSELYSIIASDFPYKLAPEQRQVIFLQQSLISIQNYLTTSHANFLSLWLDKCLEMDVEIRIGDDGLVKLVQAKEESCKNESLQSVEEEEKLELSEPPKSNIEKVDEMANKLDTVMLILFDHISISSQVLSPHSLYNMILPSFDSMILTTHRSKFVQFVFFLLCGLESNMGRSGLTLQSSNSVSRSHSSLYRDFAAKLIDVVLDKSRDTTSRQSAVCYLASFISRATYVCPETVCETVSALLQFVEIYMEHFPTELSVRNAWKTSPGTSAMIMDKTRDMVEMHSLFYTVSQAVFYVMCFRGKECIQYYKEAKKYHEDCRDTKEADTASFAEPDTVNISPERWTKLCSHHLHPLRFCLETVRGEFLLLAHSFKLLDGDLLQRLIMDDRKMATPTERSLMISPKVNKKGKSVRTAATLEKNRITGGVGGLGRGSNPLQSFFPFDPYLLCKSHRYIEIYYKSWTGSATPDSDDDAMIDSDVDHEIAQADENAADDESYENVNEAENSADESEEEIDSQTDADEYLDSFPVDSAIFSKHNITNGKRPRIESMTSNTDYSDTLSKRPRLESVNSNTDVSELGISLSREEWVQELKRSRALSISDECW